MPSWHIGCPAGKFVSGGETCVECPNDSYRSETNHQYRSCKRCTTRDNPDWQLATPCNSTHNNVYKCVSGKFNSNGDEIVCLSCLGCESRGQFETETCRHDNDVICCPYKGMKLRARAYDMPCEINSTHAGYCCIKLPTLVSTSIRPIDYSTQEQVTSSLTPSEAHESSDNSISADELSPTDPVPYIYMGVVGMTIIIAIACYSYETKCQSS